MRSNSPNLLFEFYDGYHDQVKAFVWAVVKDEWIAEDLTQETYLRAHRHIGSLRDPSKMKSWIYRIAYHICQDFFRSTGRHTQNVIQLDDLTRIADRVKTEDSLVQQQMGACVREKLGQLSEKSRTVIWLYDIIGLSHKEIAEVLGIHTDNVRTRLHRARKSLKALLERHCNFERDERNIYVCEPKMKANRAKPPLRRAVDDPKYPTI